ncbi:MAG: ABC transporter ATP-binding protein [Planctomycetia bacterium]|nr:ABC transporter ATP-binding protein [Planctomycetia bacterium]
MPIVEVTSQCPVHDSFRVRQVAGMFDVLLAAKSTVTFRAEVPEVGEPWQIGLIVGPSGSGKTTIARRAFGEAMYDGGAWPTDRAVVDCFGELPIKEITGLLTAVGFSSPPSWIKPYAVLSGGERFRCDLARALSVGVSRPPDRPQTTGERPRDDRASGLSPLVFGLFPLVAFDEFTSVVDRNVAQVGSAAVAKAIRGGRLRCRFVAISCHYDIAEWLAPDWIVDMATGTCQRRSLRRPEVRLDLFRCHRRAWPLFARHHYLNGSLSPTARCYLALWRGSAVAFCATFPLIGRRGHWRISRMVTLPDYQGIGIGMRVAEAVAQTHRDAGQRINITASHPAVVAHCAASPRWRTVRVLKTGSRNARGFIGNYRGSGGRAVVSFEYLGSEAA